MLKILWKRGEIAPQEQFLLLSTIFCYLLLEFCIKLRIRFSLREKRLFEITEVEITRVDCILYNGCRCFLYEFGVYPDQTASYSTQISVYSIKNQ